MDLLNTIAALTEFNYGKFRYLGNPISVHEFIHFVGLVTVAKSTYPGVEISEACKLVESDVIKGLQEHPPVVSTAADCGTCGGGAVR